MAFPLRYIHRNILLGKADQRSAMYSLPTVSYRFLPEDGKMLQAGQLAQFAYSAQADFSIWRVCKAYPAEWYVEENMPLLDERWQTPEVWEAWLEGHMHRLQGLKAYVPEVYVGVSLDQQRQSTGALSGAGAGMDRAMRRIQELLGVAKDQPVRRTELLALERSEQEAYDRMTSTFPYVDRLNDEDFQWLLRRCALRGLTEPTMDQWWEPNALTVDEGSEVLYTPLEADIMRHADSPITDLPRTLRIDAEEGTTYQALLCLGALPSDAEFPGARAEVLFAPLEACDFPVDAVIHCRWLSNDEARSQVRKRILDVENAFAEQMQSQIGAGYLASDDRDLARELEAYLQNEDHPPMLLATTSFALAAETEDELEQRVTRLRQAFGQTQLHRPGQIQRRLWYMHLPQPTVTQREFLEPMTIEQFGAMMPIGDQRVGSLTGPYIGYTTGGTPRPVKWDPLEASREANPTAVLLAGTPGSGKALADTTPIPTPAGWRTMRDLRVGDQAFDQRGEPCTVQGVFPQPPGRECYEIVFSDGATIVADAEHLWSTVDVAARQARTKHKTSLDHLGGSSRHRGVTCQGGRWIAQAQVAGRNRYLGSFADEDEAASAAAAYRAQHLPRRGATRSAPQVRTTVELRDSLVRWGHLNHAIPTTYPLTYPCRDLPLDPYVLGAWLGDGSKNHATIFTADPEIAGHIEAAGYQVTRHASPFGYGISMAAMPARTEMICPSCRKTFTTSRAVQRYCSQGCNARSRQRDPSGQLSKAGGSEHVVLCQAGCGKRLDHQARRLICADCKRARNPYSILGSLGVIRNKHIPDMYLRSSEQQRRALLAGLLDTDGTVAPRGAAQFDASNERLACDVHELALSLGYRATITSKSARLNGRDCGTAYRISFTTDDEVFRLIRKQEVHRTRVRKHNPQRTRYRYVVDVRPVPSVPVRCIAVDSPSHLYLAGKAMIPTHNTIAAQVLAVLAQRRGSLIVDNDPKPDHNMHEIPELKAHSRLITLSGDKAYAGVLDPLRIAPPDERADTAIDYYLGVTRETSAEWENLITSATYDVIDRCTNENREPASLMVIEELEARAERTRDVDPHDSRTAAAVAQALRNLARGGLGQLAFGTPTADVVTDDVSLISIRIPGLSIPTDTTDRANYGYKERRAIATLGLLATYSLHLVSRDTTRHKVVLFDEAWFLLASDEGQRMLSRLVRLGRAQNATILIATQMLAELGSLVDLMGTIFMFGQKSEAEAIAGLKLLGLDSDDTALVAKVRGYRKGRGLLRDLTGRVGEIQVEPVYEHVLETLDTSPQGQLARQNAAEAEAVDAARAAEEDAAATAGAAQSHPAPLIAAGANGNGLSDNQLPDDDKIIVADTSEPDPAAPVA